MRYRTSKLPPPDVRIGTQVDLYEPGWASKEPPLTHRCTVTDFGLGWFDCRLGVDRPLTGPLWDVHPGFHVTQDSDHNWVLSVRGEDWDVYITT